VFVLIKCLIVEGMPSCPPHEVVTVGSHSTDFWGRCSKCSAWVWSVDDRGKWDYSNAWVIDSALAEAAFLRGDPRAAAKLLVLHDLPYGPVWETPSALVDMLRAITPSANDRARSEALDAVPPRERWVPAAKLLRELVTEALPEASELIFELDVKFPGRQLVGACEVGDALVLFDHHEMIRITRAAGVTSVQVPEPAQILEQTPDALLFTAGSRVFLLDAAGELSSLAIDKTYKARALDGGHWLFDPGGDVRGIEIRKPDAQPLVKIAMRDFPSARRMGDGWILSQCVDDDGHDQALTLFDASFRSIAASEGVSGARMMAVIDERALWCETNDTPFTLERWERRDRVMVRTFALEVQAWARVDGGVVVRPRDTKMPNIGLDDRGEQRFTLEREDWQGATYFHATKSGMLVVDDENAEIFDPHTGARLVARWHVDSPDVRVASDGTAFVHTENELLTIGDGAPVRLFVGESMKLVATCRDAAILRDARGGFLMVGSDGQPRARFEAPNARFSVFGTRGGPYVVEPERVRVGSFR
jgi:hypothetical protein